jgi:hypothetical protein
MDFGSSQIHQLTDFSAGPEEAVEAVPKKGQAQSTRLFFARVAN